MVSATQNAAVRAIVEDGFAKYATGVVAVAHASWARAAKAGVNGTPRISSFINPPSLEASRALSRSADSKLGNTLEAIVQGLARLRFGDQDCPQFAYGVGVTPRDIPRQPTYTNKQYIASFVDLDALLDVYMGSVIDKRGNTIAGKFDALAQNPPLLKVAKLHVVDLICRIGRTWYTYELKSTGDLDSKNAPANTLKTFAFSILLGPGTEARMGLLQKEAKDSQSRNYVGARHLIGARDLWESVLPVGMSFDEFIAVLEEVGRPHLAAIDGAIAKAA